MTLNDIMADSDIGLADLVAPLKIHRGEVHDVVVQKSLPDR
jgi:hypothetical protein